MILTSSATCGTAGTIWTGWNVSWATTFSCTIIASTATAVIWTAWNENTAIAEEAQRLDADLVNAERYRQEVARFEAERATARDKAEKLLRENLSPRQVEELSERGHFHLESFSSGQRRLYRIKRGRVQNVEQIDDSGRVIKRLCAHPIELVPDADTMLAQKLWLETAEEEFLRVANHS